jgi:hypothetical protein
MIMDKILISIALIVFLLLGCFYGYSYYNGPKIKAGVISKNIDDKGRPVDQTKEFTPEDTVYFTARGNRFWVNKAQVVWYKGEIALENRVLVEDDVRINKAGYYVAQLSVPEGLEEGYYTVTIFAAGNDIRETYADFYIKK